MSERQKNLDTFLRAEMIGRIAVIVSPRLHFAMLLPPEDLGSAPLLLLVSETGNAQRGQESSAAFLTDAQTPAALVAASLSVGYIFTVVREG